MTLRRYERDDASEARRGRRAEVFLLALCLALLPACDSLLEVELPHLLTDAAIEGQATAETQVNSAIALFECGYTAFGLMALGAEDVMESIAGVYTQGHLYDETPDTGDCDTSSTNDNWFDQIMGARALISNAPERLVPTAQGFANGVYDRMQDEWNLGTAGERLSAISAIYMAASLDHLGEFLCETTMDGSDLITPPQALDLAEEWITSRALGHIDNFGDFAMPHGIAPSARDMAIALRARIRWANGNLAEAAADAATIDDGFTAWITRETGETRRNKIYHNATEVGYSAMKGVNDWWNPAIRRANPATGEAWPDPIPFTGYIFLGIMPDGRTLEAGNVPVRWAEEFRAEGDDPTPLGNGAVPDTRVQHFKKPIQGPNPAEVPARYSANDDDIPFLSWEEMRLIRADYELSQSNFSAAIDHVNVLRADKDLPQISGTYRTSLDTYDEVRAVLLEERRRELFAEGARYWSTKIQNTDMLWFPRREGQTQFQGYNLLGAVRQLSPNDEYQQNPFFIDRGGLDARGSGCTDLPGSQAPVAG